MTKSNFELEVRLSAFAFAWDLLGRLPSRGGKQDTTCALLYPRYPL